MYPLKQKGLHPVQMLEQLPTFIAKIEGLASELGLTLADYQADHIALRVNDWELAEQLHLAWLAYGDEWSNNTINGRPIVVIGFHQPLQIGAWTIEALELPYPGDKQYPHEGWEHVEFVIPSQVTETDALKVVLNDTFPALAMKWDGFTEQGVKVKASCPSGDKERLANPTYAFKKNGVCIKLHPCSLKAVIASEDV
ncbi:VOC family protein [Photobacterium nomapromontoriensis]|uniref:VOC family protein n=1 Tax=Photobacterium nomapromontoriensis TaxID=2910237 RepID=UPI003D0B3B1F